jgi:hypothetical protein
MQAKGIYVNSTAADDAGSGAIDSPYKTFKKALSEATTDGDTIYVSGTIEVYTELGTTTGYKDEIAKNIQLFIFGLGEDSGFDGQNQTRLFDLSGNQKSTVFKNLTFQNANTTNDQGGAFKIRMTNASFEDCNFLNNTSKNGNVGKGGAVYYQKQNQSLSFKNCRFEGNVSCEGGAFRNEDEGSGVYTGVTSLENCSFLGNSGTKGGAIGVSGGIVEIDGCVFTGNSSNRGGAMFIAQGNNTPLNVKVVKTIFKANLATIEGTDRQGGAVFYDGDGSKTSTLAFEACAFISNDATVGGGAFMLNDKADKTSNILNLSVINSTFYDNYSGTGAAIRIQNGKSESSLAIINCTLTKNRGNGGDGGIIRIDNNDGARAIPKTILNTITEDNGTTDDIGFQSYNDANTYNFTIKNSFISKTNANASSFTLENSEIKYYSTLKAALGAWDEETNSIPLGAGSLALGYGDLSFLASSTIKTADNKPTDQLGNPRPHFPGLTTCAIGAVEEVSSIWKGVSADWTDADNWVNGIPTTDRDVIIPGNNSVYPTLTAENAAIANNIYFETGGEIGQIQHLTYNKAFVELNLGYYNEEGEFVNAKPTSKSLQRNRFYTITAPLKEMVSGDFAFGGKPTAYAQYADPVNGETVDPVQGFTNTLPYYNVPLTKGFGFAYFVNHSPEEEGANISETNPAAKYDQTNLNSVQGIVSFPYFANDNLRNSLNPYHAFDGAKSIFSYYRLDGEPVTTPADEVTRDLSLANRFIAEEEGVIPASFILPLNEVDAETLVGNPFLSHLDFTQLYVDNKEVLSNYYRIWKGNASYVVEVDETNGTFVSSTNSDNGADETLIAPLQSVFVERKAAGDFTVNVANVSVTKANGASQPALRAANTEMETLKIIARNENEASAVVLHRDTEVEESGIRKVFTVYDEVPELYFDKEKALEILTIDKNTISVPLGIKALDEEAITLSFTGIENLSDPVRLYDTKENQKIVLDANASYPFTHDVNAADRFFLLFGNEIPTNIASFDKTISVSCKDNQIKVVSSSFNPIRSVKIFNMQGQLIHAGNHLSVPVYSAEINAKGIYIVEVQTENVRINKKTVNY